MKARTFNLHTNLYTYQLFCENKTASPDIMITNEFRKYIFANCIVVLHAVGLKLYVTE